MHKQIGVTLFPSFELIVVILMNAQCNKANKSHTINIHIKILKESHLHDTSNEHQKLQSADQ